MADKGTGLVGTGGTFGRMLRLFDTARGQVVPLEPRDPGKVSIYVCGPTVYGPPHLGHGRYAVVYDVLRRYLEWGGFAVTFVSNVTDVDDNIIERANREGRTATEIAERCEEVWYRAMEAIDVRRPDDDPHASAYIDEMIELIADLERRGFVYETSDGAYFEAERVEGYGLLARQPIASLRAGARVEASDEKRSPVDFVLWKKAKPGEPSWESPWGAGRPGWHTECVVMSLGLLGDGFDIHTGGQELAFPHHENERAQALAAGHRFARHWIHHGWVMVENEKMSKSLGNFTNLLDLIETVDPRAFRLLVLQSHYRAPMEVSGTTTAAAGAALERLDAFARRAAGLAGDADAAALEAFRTAMDDDLDTPAAVALLFDLVRRANTALDAGDEGAAAPLAAAVREMAGAFGLRLRSTDDEVPAEIAALAAERDRARAAKDWASADRIRDQLQAEGWAVEDTPTGTQVRRR
jgi:cysteinyl-tRNA synthetase